MAGGLPSSAAMGSAHPVAYTTTEVRFVEESRGWTRDHKRSRGITRSQLRENTTVP
jgi:hypothetical protein